MVDVRVSRRRANNLFWAGAQDYQLVPPYQFEDLEGKSDLYQSLLFGLAYQYFDREEMEAWFACLREGPHPKRYLLLAFYALEKVLYQKELVHRPVLEKLRKDWARSFLDDRLDLAWRTFSLTHPLVASLYLKRAHAILGQPFPLAGKALRYYKRLDFSGEENLEELKEALQALQDQDHFLGRKQFSALLPGGLTSFFQKLSMLTPRQLEISVDPSQLASKRDWGLGLSAWQAWKMQTAEGEIEEKFGPSLLSIQERELLDLALTSKRHRKKHLWLTEGLASQDLQRQEGQMEDWVFRENKKKFQENAGFYRRIIDQMSRQIGRILALAAGEEEWTSRSGKLQGPLAWRSQLPHYDKIFSRRIPASRGDFSVDLLLDASASRMAERTEIAIEAYIISSALDRLEIPLRVLAFSTVGDYSVLTRLKDYQEQAGDKIFRYFPRGWNRDGYVLRAMEKLLVPGPGRPSGASGPLASGGRSGSWERKLLLLLTDLQPRDLKPMGGSLPHAYEGDRALEDMLEALGNLRRKKISLAAMVTTSTKDRARRLFPGQFLQIHSIQQMADAASRFLCRELEKLARS